MVRGNLGRLASLLLGGLLLGLVGPGCQTNPPLTAVAQRQPLYSVGPEGTVTRLPDPAGGIELAQYQYTSRFGPGQDPFLQGPHQFVRRSEAGPEPRKLPMPRELPPQEEKEKDEDKDKDKDKEKTEEQALPPEPPPPPPLPIPTELARVFPPCYVIEPPDVLFLEAVRVVPRGPYRIEPLDVLQVNVVETAAGKPIAGPFTVSPDGTLNLGYDYGSVRVRGLTLEQAAEAVRQHLMRRAAIANPQVTVALAAFRGLQQIRGEHLVGQDGTINLGTYGCVSVVGLSLKQAKYAIEQHLSQFLQDPLVSVQVAAYNSKVYYVIADGAGFGQSVYRIPITGNETVLDAVSAIGGLPVVSNRKRMWLARPAPAGKPCYQILPIDWDIITKAGGTATNYQLFPGDRIYIGPDPLVLTDNTLAKVFAPIERIFGITLLGSATVQSFRNFNNRNGNGFFTPFF
jgi:polysaccharide biosynthesis/export protein